MRVILSIGLSLLLAGLWSVESAEKIRIAEYNLENYLDQPAGNRPAKSAEARAKIRQSIRSLKPDVLALMEMGSTNALLELRDSLQAEGLSLPHWEWVRGWDTNIHVALLSRLPIVARRPHTNLTYLLYGRRFHVSRGFLEVDLRATNGYQFTLLAVHLKSRRPIPEGDEAEMREQEARLLREIITERLAANPSLNLVVLGDFNDTKDTRSVRTIMGRANARNGLVDTRPAERNGDSLPPLNARQDARRITWTHYYGVEDSYSRIDYILLSKGMAAEWIPEETYVLALPNWGQASDHRPIVATIYAEDR
ncbi:endonuclease/exonuclease/phosphatase family protein [Fontisphaera persica]|uniref:endonuclease/exonuclease/phosphatase family protein n=1 Tax=Fontisphaera persica TaxID=2974023 RepID=UPI0024BF9BC6|nr:endonuclease/exonuclease/phosphatase family protein [Fontisphaera persica]WCJ60541.1 endonuclease/exonuclease/phosphatase family protein [Fontisphaera persica]